MICFWDYLYRFHKIFPPFFCILAEDSRSGLFLGMFYFSLRVLPSPIGSWFFCVWLFVGIVVVGDVVLVNCLFRIVVWRRLHILGDQFLVVSYVHFVLLVVVAGMFCFGLGSVLAFFSICVCLYFWEQIGDHFLVVVGFVYYICILSVRLFVCIVLVHISRWWL